MTADAGAGQVEGRPQPAGFLGIFAHPDDETFGIGGSMAILAEQGHPVWLICATNGDEGASPDDAGDHAMDPEIRRSELRCACAALGAHEPIFLDYVDSGMENWERKPGTFADADREEVVGRLIAEMRRLRPAVVVTFDPGGIYGHPDHVRISDVATEAFHRLHPEPGGPVSLYHHALPHSVAEAMLAGWAANDDTPDARPPTEDDLLQRRRFIELARPDADMTTTIDVRAGLDRKRAAFACHASQLRGEEFEFEDAEGAERMEEMFGTEVFIRVVPAPPPGEQETWFVGLSNGVGASRR
jgi:LmbE family N-acetylglucosaminyl deacetylase